MTFPEPDVTNCGGVTVFMKVCHLAEAFNLPVTSHGAHDVTVHLLAAAPNRSYLEAHGFGLDRFIAEPLRIEDGRAIAPDRPGHGIDVRLEGAGCAAGEVRERAMKVGFIGLGIMGASMASNVQKGGHELVVHDLRRGGRQAAPRRGRALGRPRRARWRRPATSCSPRCRARRRWRPSRSATTACWRGMRAGTAYFDLSTNSPTVVRRIHAAFAASGVAMLDAPVSGGPRGARTRQAGDLGRRRRGGLPARSSPCSTRWATR